MTVKQPIFQDYQLLDTWRNVSLKQAAVELSKGSCAAACIVEKIWKKLVVEEENKERFASFGHTCITKGPIGDNLCYIYKNFKRNREGDLTDFINSILKESYVSYKKIEYKDARTWKTIVHAYSGQQSTDKERIRKKQLGLILNRLSEVNVSAMTIIASVESCVSAADFILFCYVLECREIKGSSIKDAYKNYIEKNLSLSSDSLIENQLDKNADRANKKFIDFAAYIIDKIRMCEPVTDKILNLGLDNHIAIITLSKVWAQTDTDEDFNEFCQTMEKNDCRGEKLNSCFETLKKSGEWTNSSISSEMLFLLWSSYMK